MTSVLLQMIIVKTMAHTTLMLEVELSDFSSTPILCKIFDLQNIQNVKCTPALSRCSVVPVIYDSEIVFCNSS